VAAMARQRSASDPEQYGGPERRHIVPCEGLVELQRAGSRWDAEIQSFREHFVRQNGSIQHIDEKSDRIEGKVDTVGNKADLLDAKVQSGASDRQRQIEGVVKDVDSIRRDLSDYHSETLKEVAKAAQDTTRLVVGAAISGLVLLTGAVITLLTKLSSLP
jgi:hypothetical protein